MLTDADLVKKTYHDLYNQREKEQHYTVKLPCHNVSVEVTKASDSYLECPECHKHYLLTHSAVRNKLYAE